MFAILRSLPHHFPHSRHLWQIQRTKVSLPDLPYEYDALEPVISAEIMQLHHQKHHQAYVDNLNNCLDQLAEAKSQNDIKKMIELVPSLRFNGGGHINHATFWKNLAPVGETGEPKGELLEAINKNFESLDKMKSRLSQMAIGVQGSGWVWLGMCPIRQKLITVVCPNQDPLQSTTGLTPLFGIDVWEHAYYLQYKNARAQYVEAIWKVANWNDIERRFLEVKA